jgi:hypothetical protein
MAPAIESAWPVRALVLLMAGLASSFLHLGHKMRKHHRRRDDRVPVAQNQRMDALVLKPEADGVLVGFGRLAAGNIDRIARRTKRRNELAESRIQIIGHFHQSQPVVETGIRQQHARSARTGDDQDILALGCRQHLHAAGSELEHRCLAVGHLDLAEQAERRSAGSRGRRGWRGSADGTG